MTLRIDAPRKKTRWGLLTVSVSAALLLFASSVFAGAAANSGFEGADGNLVHNSATDWNDFAAGTNGWTGTAPYQSRTEVVLGWSFNGLTDAQASTTDTGFVGGTKQDKDCAGVNGSKAPNKDDLKRVYLATKTVSGHTYLALAWERIPQNTVNASAHVGFEFNQANPTTQACGAGHDGLVHRLAGDMLIVYDFEGSSSGSATLTIRRWVTSGSCEISSDSAPCWGPAATLTTVGGTTAEALVDAATYPVDDTLAPGGTDHPGQSEFGEAIVDLTQAQIFSSNSTTCTSFGQAEAVSRSSGNSGQAAMEDLVGPAHFTLSNCATVIIHKVTNPSTDTTTSFNFTKNFTTDPTTSNTFSLTGGGTPPAAAQTQTYSGTVFPKTGATVTESDPSPLYALTSIVCTTASTATNVDPNATNSTDGSGTAARTVSFDIAAGQTLECTFTNTFQKQPSAMNTSPWIYPNDTASVTSTGATGTVTFRLYNSSANCNATTPSDTVGTGGLLYKETVTLDSSGNASTSNTGTPVSSSTTVYWRAAYSGDGTYLGRMSACTENIETTLTGDSSGGSAP